MPFREHESVSIQSANTISQRHEIEERSHHGIRKPKLWMERQHGMEGSSNWIRNGHISGNGSRNDEVLSGSSIRPNGEIKLVRLQSDNSGNPNEIVNRFAFSSDQILKRNIRNSHPFFRPSGKDMSDIGALHQNQEYQLKSFTRYHSKPQRFQNFQEGSSIQNNERKNSPLPSHDNSEHVFAQQSTELDLSLRKRGNPFVNGDIIESHRNKISRVEPSLFPMQINNKHDLCDGYYKMGSTADFSSAKIQMRTDPLISIRTRHLPIY